MLFKIKETGKYIRVTLLPYYKNNEAGIDVFSSFEINVPLKRELEQETNAYIIDSDSYYNIINYWKEQIELYNKGDFSEQFGDKEEQLVDYFVLYKDIL